MTSSNENEPTRTREEAQAMGRERAADLETKSIVQCSHPDCENRTLADSADADVTCIVGHDSQTTSTPGIPATLTADAWGDG